jgi:hypothetical protein
MLSTSKLIIIGGLFDANLYFFDRPVKGMLNKYRSDLDLLFHKH